MSDKTVAVLSHGKADKDENEDQKGIYLSDGFLSLSDVYNYKANTEFLILGACETGVGHKENNEGSINLARAFTSIGVKSMLLSSWEIDEYSSMKIIKSFLEYLDKSDTKSAALQKAKLNYLATATPRTANPLYWAGLNITGNNESIPLHKTNYYWYALGLIPLSFGLWFFRKKSRRKKKITD
jgi:CHAT domain-containing protein